MSNPRAYAAITAYCVNTKCVSSVLPRSIVGLSPAINAKIHFVQTHFVFGEVHSRPYFGVWGPPVVCRNGTCSLGESYIVSVQGVLIVDSIVFSECVVPYPLAVVMRN